MPNSEPVMRPNDVRDNWPVGGHMTNQRLPGMAPWVLACFYDRDIKALEGYEHTVDDAVALKTACLKYGISVQESDEISPVNYRHMTRRLVDAVKRGFYEMPDQAENRRLIAALEWYGDEANHDRDAESVTWAQDRGSLARAVLADIALKEARDHG